MSSKSSRPNKFTLLHLHGVMGAGSEGVMSRKHNRRRGSGSFAGFGSLPETSRVGTVLPPASRIPLLTGVVPHFPVGRVGCPVGMFTFTSLLNVPVRVPTGRVLYLGLHFVYVFFFFFFFLFVVHQSFWTEKLVRRLEGRGVRTSLPESLVKWA